MSTVAAGRAALVCLASAFLATDAKADATKDCNALDDPERVVRGCSALIKGKRLDKKNLPSRSCSAATPIWS
jgi:hypothetical protein